MERFKGIERILQILNLILVNKKVSEYPVLNPSYPLPSDSSDGQVGARSYWL
jgi:hypothetical protein